MTWGQSLIGPPWRTALQPWDARMSSRRSIQSPDLYSGQVTQSHSTLGNYWDSSFLSLGWSPGGGKAWRASLLMTPPQQQPYWQPRVSFLPWKTGKSCFSLSATQSPGGTTEPKLGLQSVWFMFNSCPILVLISSENRGLLLELLLLSTSDSAYPWSRLVAFITEQIFLS